MERPLIAVVRWEPVRAESIDAYRRRVREAGGRPLTLARGDSRRLPSRVAGMVLTGGIDVDPAAYGQAPHEKVTRWDRERDDFEMALLRQALARDLPVLAICRGHQLLNVALGGALLQHIQAPLLFHRADYKSPGVPSRWHDVRLTAGSRLRAVLGTDETRVNSRHHQAVLPETLAPGLLAAAFSPDGLVEAAESPDHGWVVSVQWHPEREEMAEQSRPLFRAFVAAAAEYAARLAREAAAPGR